MSCLDQIRILYTEYTGLEISAAIAQVRAELEAQRVHTKTEESILTTKYNPVIQEEIGPVEIPKPVKKTRAKKDLTENDE